MATVAQDMDWTLTTGVLEGRKEEERNHPTTDRLDDQGELLYPGRRQGMSAEAIEIIATIMKPAQSTVLQLQKEGVDITNTRLSVAGIEKELGTPVAIEVVIAIALAVPIFEVIDEEMTFLGPATVIAVIPDVDLYPIQKIARVSVIPGEDDMAVGSA